ncbi:hypothetical protein BDV18DRAFT_130114 [Aspergillus unguis]
MTNSQFQLFPPPAPQGVPKNPFRKGPRRPSIDTQSTIATPVEELKNTATEAKAVVFQVVEPHTIKPPPQAHVPALPPRSSTPKLKSTASEESLYSSSPQAERKGPLAKETNSSFNEGNVRDATSLRPVSPPQPSASPIVPIKSIFPQLNPNVPLSQQQSNGGAPNNNSRPRHRPVGLKLDITPAPEIDRALGPNTVPADVYDFPTSILSPAGIQYSTPEQLKTLWEATNGQRPDGLSKAFNLRMERLDPATFVFGDPNVPFYTMQTYSTNEVSITRRNPIIPNSSIPIMMLQLEDRRRRDPPNDGLVSHLLSRLAAMLAIDQAAELSRQHQLSPPDAADVETNALKRAAALESCKLSWNPMKRIYELRHPSINQRGALHITVFKPTNQNQNRGQPQAPTILVTAPLPNNAVDVAAVASPRTSTLPLSGSESDSDEPLASLDLRTMTLSISAAAINSTIPSLYAIDSIVAAILAVAVADLSSNPVLADMPIYDPTKTQTQAQIPTAPQPAHTNKPKLFATLAEREDGDSNSNSEALALPPQAQTQHPLKTHPKWLPSWNPLRLKIRQLMRRRNSKSKSTRNSPTSPAVEEIDLEKYGINTSQSAKRTSKDEELPGLARGLMKLISWGFKLAFWALTVAFKLFTWVLSVVYRCVTGEKA